jgi:hypothetical protein
MTTKPTATERETRELLRELGVAGKMDESAIGTLLRTPQIRAFQRMRTGVAAAVRGALGRMQRADQLEIERPVKGSRKPWGAWGSGEVALQAVQTRMRKWIRESTLDKQRITVRKAYDQYKKQYGKAGGTPNQLRQDAKNELRNLALKGGLMKREMQGEGNLLNLFSGGQSAHDPAVELGFNPVHVDIVQEYPLGEGKVAGARTSTDLTQAPEGKMIPWVEARESMDSAMTTVVAMAIPCHTWTPLDATLRPKHGRFDRSYRTRTGKPNTKNPEKAAEAESQAALAANAVGSVLAWVEQGAYIGEQRFFWIENPMNSILRTKPPAFMQGLPDPTITS